MSIKSVKTRRSKKCRFYIVERKERKTADSTQVSVSSFTFCYFSEIWMSLTWVGLILDSRKFQTMNKLPQKMLPMLSEINSPAAFTRVRFNSLRVRLKSLIRVLCIILILKGSIHSVLVQKTSGSQP